MSVQLTIQLAVVLLTSQFMVSIVYQLIYCVYCCIFGLVTPRFITEPQNVEELIGNSVNLSCSAEGFPVPEITWFFNDMMMITNETTTTNSTNVTNIESILMIPDLALSDGGDYSCQIDSAATSMPLSSSTAIVTVIGGKTN